MLGFDGLAHFFFRQTSRNDKMKWLSAFWVLFEKKRHIIFSFSAYHSSSYQKKEVLMRGTARVRNILKEIISYLCHIHQVLFFVSVYRDMALIALIYTFPYS